MPSILPHGRHLAWGPHYTVAMPEVITKPGIEIVHDEGDQLADRFHLILLDDQEHTYNYVIHMLGAVFGYSREKAYAIACMVDAQGEAVLMTGGHEEVKLKQEAVHAFGADPHMPESKGSMSAIIQPAG